MEAINTFFKGLADKINLPDFFKSNTLLFNNFFLTAVAALSLILLVITIAIPGKNKKISYYRAAERR